MSETSSTSSPTHLAGEVNHFYDPNFTAEISQKMRVPKRIKVDGESNEPVLNGPNYEHAWSNPERLDMRVPERIIVLGHDEHYGTRSFSPPEMLIENAVRPPDPSSIRIETPPRVITLDKHHYPSADEFVPPPYMIEPPQPPRPAPRTALNTSIEPDTLNSSSRELMNISDMNHIEGMTTSEEVIHLRKQLAKLSRRVMTIELECMQRQQRDKIIYAIGLVYIFFKTMVWLSRSN